ncbi:MAG TPA: hypothetical protein VFP56_02690 [Candidatus Limnocylindrales bacterium]|nr:hypothetical protein [Candidatus Limnocylindrales bacterium]
MDRGSTVRRLAAGALVALAALGCGGGNTTPPDVSPDPQTVTALDGRFELRFTVDRTTLRPGDPITGTAELWLKAGGSGVLSGSSDLFSFEFLEVGGQQRGVAPVISPDCSPHQVGADRPLTSAIYRSGAPKPAGANAEFVRQFLAGDAINLPAGTWDITAIAGFVDGRSCAGLPHAIRSTVRVTVTG